MARFPFKYRRKRKIFQRAHSCKTTFKFIVGKQRWKRQKYVGLRKSLHKKISHFLCLQMMFGINHQSYPPKQNFFLLQFFRARKKAEQIYPCECCPKLHRPYLQNVHQSFTTFQHIAFTSLFTRSNYSKNVIFSIL